MEEPIQKIDGITFDLPKINKDIQQIILLDPIFDQVTYKKMCQISLRKSETWFDGIGSLYDYEQRKFTRGTADFSEPSPKLKGSYLEEVINRVEQQAQLDSVRVGRIRIMKMLPKTCYTLHTDPEEFRYHIPLRTNPGAFFVVDNKVCRMDIPGQLFRFKTNAEHTAVNASTAERIHIVFDTF